MAITKDQKAVILQELVDKFGRSKSVVFAKYRGLDVAKLSELRGNLRKGNAELKVAKKTLMGLAAKQNSIGEIDAGYMEGPVAAAFSYEDALSGIKILFNFSKQNDKLELLGGVIDGKVVGPEVIAQYAKLPSREELLAKLLGSMNAPISGTVGLFSNLIAGFVRVVNAYKDTLPAEATAAAPAVEERAEEAPKQEDAASAPAEAAEATEKESPTAEAEGEKEAA